MINSQNKLANIKEFRKGGLGIMNILKKTRNCSNCGKDIFKKELYGFDSTLRGKVKGEKLKLCRECFFQKLESYIKKFPYRALFFNPVQKENAYHFYQFEVSYDIFHDHSSSIDENVWLKHYPLLVGLNVKCECGNNAQYTWCQSEENIDTYNFDKFDAEDIKVNHLCPVCLFKIIKSTIVENNITWYEFFPPVEKEGMCISGEV